MKKRRHHNNKGLRRIKRHKTKDDIERFRRKFGVAPLAQSVERTLGKGKVVGS